MSTHSVNKKPLSLIEIIENNPYEKIKHDGDSAEMADEILFEASTFIEKARNEQELIAIYQMLATELEIGGLPNPVGFGFLFRRRMAF
jgi:hypothetical protein